MFKFFNKQIANTLLFYYPRFFPFCSLKRFFITYTNTIPPVKERKKLLKLQKERNKELIKEILTLYVLERDCFGTFLESM